MMLVTNIYKFFYTRLYIQTCCILVRMVMVI